MKIKITLSVVCFVVFTFNNFSQNPNTTPDKFKPDYNQNYFTQIEYWDAFYDSLSTTIPADSKAPGLNGYNHWKDFWAIFMPSSGNFQEAFEVRSAYDHQMEYEYFLSYDSNKVKSSSQSIEWEEIGPKDPSKIKGRFSGSWINPHINNNGNLRFDGHVGKLDRLYKHPIIPTTIYASAGTLFEGGGGLFRSVDNGHEWVDLGTDKIINPNVNSFVVKPIGEQPDPSNEYMFIGMAAGKVYRTKDDGLNWIQCDQSSAVNSSGNTTYQNIGYPIINNNGYQNSLPWSDWNNPIGKELTEINTRMLLTKSSLNSSSYARLVVCRTGGLFYSDNYTQDLIPDLNTNSLLNKIEWNEFDFSSIYSDIPLISGISFDVRFQDVVAFEKDGDFYYLTHFETIEKDINGNYLNGVREYVAYSINYGQSWQFLGGLVSIDSPQGRIISGNNKFSFAKIQCKDFNPNFLHIALPDLGTNNFVIHKYDFSFDSWTEITGNMYTGVGIQANGFTIDPNNEENWWLYTNHYAKSINGTFSIESTDYGTNFHPDVRDMMILQNGEFLAATDGGVYRSNTGHIFDFSSNGINCAESDRMAVAQKPPFYVSSGFWHCGLQIYNSDIDEWHWKSAGDGNDGEILFLNNEVFTVRDQFGGMRVLNDFNTLDLIKSFKGVVRGSENIQQRAYGMLDLHPAVDKTASIIYSNDDFSNYNNLNIQTHHNVNSVKVIPNEPDLLGIRDFNSGNPIFYIYSGFNQVTPNPVLEKSFNASDVYGNPNADLEHIVFDPRRNGICYFTLKTSPPWGQSSAKRIVEFDLNTLSIVQDITFKIEDDVFTNQSDIFPDWINITDLAMDRQTGVLYMGTGGGIYYLDRENEIWRKFSKNVPYFRPKLGIIHCTGEIYVSTLNRGVWKAPLIRDENHPTLEWNITSNETWEDRMNLFCTLVIEDGATLTVKGDLVVYGDQKIVVKPGGRLHIDGGKITTECGSMWQGIELQGDASQHQSVSTQGVVEIKNGGTIEYAQNGITTIGVDAAGNKDWSKTGGIIRIENATFKNCRRGIEFLSYQNFNPVTGAPRDNISYVRNTSFINDAPLPDDIIPYCGISLYDVDDVILSNLTFDNSFATTATLAQQRGSGIIALDANITLKPSYDASGNAIPTTISSFKNLNYGIIIAGAGGLSSSYIRENDFENNEVAILLDGAAMTEVVKNNIVLPNEPFDNSNTRQAIGIVADHATGYLVSENNITVSATGSSWARGSYTKNTNITSGQFYKNFLSDVAIGEQIEGQNTQYNIDCNEYTRLSRSVLDIYHHEGFLVDQGGNVIGTSPRHNKFINTCDPVLNSQIYKESLNTNSWTYTAVSGSIEQLCVDDDVSVVDVFASNQCLSKVEDLVGGGIIAIPADKLSIKGLKDEIAVIQNELSIANDATYINLINTAPDWQIRNDLVAAGAGLSNDVLIALINKPNPVADYVVNDVLMVNTPIADEVIIKLMQRGVYQDWVIQNVLLQSIPVSNEILKTLILDDYPDWMIENNLINNSPLYDEVLTTMVAEETFPDWAQKNVLMKNTPLSASVNQAIANRTNPLPTWVMNAVNNSSFVAAAPGTLPNGVTLIDTYTPREVKEKTIEIKNREKLILVDKVVRAYLDTNWIDSARVFLETEGSPEALCALVPIEVRSDTIKTKGHLASLRAIAATMDTIKYGKQKVELNSFCDFYQDMIRFSNRAGGLMNLNGDELNILERYARGTTAIASNARAVLNHIKQNTHSYNLENPNFFYGNGKSGTLLEVSTSNEEVKEQDYFMVYPNPSDAVITIDLIEYGNGCNNCSIVISDLSGKVFFKGNARSTMQVDISGFADGVYLISLKENEHYLSVKKLIVRH